MNVPARCTEISKRRTDERKVDRDVGVRRTADASGSARHFVGCRVRQDSTPKQDIKDAGSDTKKPPKKRDRLLKR